MKHKIKAGNANSANKDLSLVLFHQIQAVRAPCHVLQRVLEGHAQQVIIPLQCAVIIHNLHYTAVGMFSHQKALLPPDKSHYDIPA